jgi:hypothetical protein
VKLMVRTEPGVSSGTFVSVTPNHLVGEESAISHRVAIHQLVLSPSHDRDIR